MERARPPGLKPLTQEQERVASLAVSAARQVTANEIWQALQGVIDSSDARPELKGLLKKGANSLRKLEGDKFIPAAFSVTLSYEASLGVGYQEGLDMVFFPHPKEPGIWEVGLFQYRGGSVGGQAHLSAGLGVSVIYNMNHMDEYAGPYCAGSLSGTKLLGLDVSGQIGCDMRDLKTLLGIPKQLRAIGGRAWVRKAPAVASDLSSRMMALALSGTTGVGGGASVAITDYTEISRRTIRTEQVAEVASKWLKERRAAIPAP